MAPILSDTEIAGLLPVFVRQDLRLLPTEELLWQRDLMGFVALDPDVDDVPARTATATHQAITDEIEYRRRIVEANDRSPLRPRWPDTSAQSYRALLRLAQDLKTLWPIEAFVTRFIGAELRPAGKSLVGRCPLPGHDDHTPSFHVYPSTDRWHCFGCGRGGDIFELTGLYFDLERFRDKVRLVYDVTPEPTEAAP